MLVMAPEGTCGDGRCMLRFRTGAFVPGAPVLPICFRYNKRKINPAWTIINEGWHFVSLSCDLIQSALCSESNDPSRYPSSSVLGDSERYLFSVEDARPLKSADTHASNA